MTSLILEPTITAQWHALVKEAEQNSHLTLTEELESYLVFLLLRFNNQPEISAGVLGIEFLKSHQLNKLAQQKQLRDIGDKCLLFAGLFPGYAEHCHVKVSYFIELGQSAYHNLAMLSAQQMATLYIRLGKSFIVLMDVLHAMREQNRSHPLTPLQTLELWHDTHNALALKKLRLITQGLPVAENNGTKH
jgi:hypothetical protein